MISRKKLLELRAALIRSQLMDEECLAHPERSALQHHRATLASIAIDLGKRDLLLAPADAVAAKHLAGTPFKDACAEARIAASPTKKAGDALLVEACHEAARRKRESKDSVVAVVCGSRAAQPAVWQKALRSAARRKLPLIFIRLEPHARAVARTSAPAALAHGVPLIAVDGSDVVAAYRVASESLARARERRGATIISSLFAGEVRDAVNVVEAYMRARKILIAPSRKAIAKKGGRGAR